MVATTTTSVFNLDAWMKQKATGSVMIEHVGDFSSEYIDSVLPSVAEPKYIHRARQCKEESFPYFYRVYTELISSHRV